MIKNLSILSLLFWANFCLAQVNFTQFPLHKQLVGRDLSNNLGSVRIEGSVDFTGANFQKIYVECLRDGVLYATQQQSLDGSLPQDDFAFVFQIPAELANYTFRVYGLDGVNALLLAEANEVVAGDVYIIEGQSNAEAPRRSDSCYMYESPFIRVYAGGMPFENNLLNNNNWYYGQGDGNRFTNGNTGQWGLKFAREIVDKYQIPVAIFNGAHGGKEIAFFQRPIDYSTSVASNYGRLYYRLNKTGLKEFVRAVLWSQGERDGSPGIGTTTDSYKAMFLALRDAWYEDFPAIQGLYIFQSRNGCTAPMHDIMEIKEAQRQLAMENSDIQIISTAGLDFFNDNCHFNFVGGYEEFAARLFALVDRDIYGASIPPDSDSPLILNAYLMGNNTVRVETNAVALSGTPLFNEFLLTDANGATILNAYCAGSSYYLELDSDPGDSAKISYLGPNPGLSGNHITNSLGIELICYYRYPITAQSIMANEVVSIENLTVYPNPANDVLLIKGTQHADYEIVSPTGQVVLRSAAPELSVAHLPNGVYFLKVNSETSLQIAKITIQH